MAFKERIRELRKAKGWGQKELAAKAGVKQATVAGWESGRHEVNPSHRGELCKIFGVKEGELFSEEKIIKSLDPEILQALNDPIAVKALLVTFKNKQDVKNTIKAILDCIPDLSPQKRQALIALCK